MRILLLSLGLVAFGSSAGAQQLAEVAVIARVRVPDFLNVQVAGISETGLRDGKQVRRVTLYVTANRQWSLSVVRMCASSCSNVEVSATAFSGSRGKTSVVVEYRWERGEPAPALNEFHYALAGT